MRFFHYLFVGLAAQVTALPIVLPDIPHSALPFSARANFHRRGGKGKLDKFRGLSQNDPAISKAIEPASQTPLSSLRGRSEGSSGENFQTPDGGPSPGRQGSESSSEDWKTPDESPSRGEGSDTSNENWQTPDESLGRGSEVSDEDWKTPKESPSRGEGSESVDEDWQTPKDFPSPPALADGFNDPETCLDCQPYGPLNWKGKQREQDSSPDQSEPSNQGEQGPETASDSEQQPHASSPGEQTLDTAPNPPAQGLSETQQELWDSIKGTWDDPIDTSDAMIRYNDAYAKLEVKDATSEKITDADIAELDTAREDVVYSTLKGVKEFGTITTAGAMALSQFSTVNNGIVYDAILDHALWRSVRNPNGETEYQRYNPDMNELAKGELAGYAVASRLMDDESRAAQNLATAQIVDLASQPEVFARLGVFEGLPEATKSSADQLDTLANMVRDGMAKTDWYFGKENNQKIMSHTLLAIIKGPEEYANLLSKAIIPTKADLLRETNKIAKTVQLANLPAIPILETVDGMTTKQFFGIVGGAVGGAAVIGGILGGLFGGGIFASKKKRYSQKEGHTIDCHGPCKPISNHAFKQEMPKSSSAQPADTKPKPLGGKGTSTTATALVTSVVTSQVFATTHTAAPTFTSKPEVTRSHTTLKKKKHGKGSSSTVHGPKFTQFAKNRVKTTFGIVPNPTEIVSQFAKNHEKVSSSTVQGPTTTSSIFSQSVPSASTQSPTTSIATLAEPTPTATPKTNNHGSNTSIPTQSPTTSEASLSQPRPSVTSTQTPTTTRAALSTAISSTPPATSIDAGKTFSMTQSFTASTSALLQSTPSASTPSFEQSTPSTMAAPTIPPPVIAGPGSDHDADYQSPSKNPTMGIGVGIAAVKGDNTNTSTVISSTIPLSTGSTPNGIVPDIPSAYVPSFNGTSIENDTNSSVSTSAIPINPPNEGIAPQWEPPNRHLISLSYGTNSTFVNQTVAATPTRTPFALPTGGKYFLTASGYNRTDLNVTAFAPTWLNSTTSSVKVLKVTTLGTVTLPSSTFVIGTPNITYSETQRPNPSMSPAPSSWGAYMNGTTWNGTIWNGASNVWTSLPTSVLDTLSEVLSGTGTTRTAAAETSSAVSATWRAGDFSKSSSTAPHVPLRTGTFDIPPPPSTLPTEASNLVDVLNSTATFRTASPQSTFSTIYVATPSKPAAAATMSSPTSGIPQNDFQPQAVPQPTSIPSWNSTDAGYNKSFANGTSVNQTASDLAGKRKG